MRRRIIFIAVAWMLTSGTAGAQEQPYFRSPRIFNLEERGGKPERPELETDRDAFTPATSTVGRRTTVVETSYSFIDNRNVAETHSFPETLLRRGIGENLELRLGWNYEVGGAGDIVSGNSAGEEAFDGRIERESQLLYGFKARLTEQRGLIPRSALITQAYTPTSGESPATDYLFAYTAGWKIAERFRLDTSMRYGSEHDKHDVFNQWAPSVVLRTAITERWNAHVEYFGIYSDCAEHEFSRAFFSPGTHFLITENLELGVRGGWGLTDDSPSFFSNVGIGLRF